MSSAPRSLPLRDTSVGALIVLIAYRAAVIGCLRDPSTSLPHGPVFWKDTRKLQAVLSLSLFHAPRRPFTLSLPSHSHDYSDESNVYI